MFATRLLVRNEPSIDWTCPKNARFNFGLRLANAFLANEWLADVFFYLPKEDRTIPAHSLILAAASPVLERFCFKNDGSSVTGGSNSPIFTMPNDLPVDTFEIVLRFIYTGIVAEGDLNASNAKSIAQVAEYLDLRELQAKCWAIIEKGLTTENVCSVFDECYSLDFAIRKTCLTMMQHNTRTILNNGTAMRMSNKALADFLKSDSLDISDESELVAPMIVWADAECAARGIDAKKPSNRRLVLDPRLHCIRFAAMSLRKFMSCNQTLGDNVLTDLEVRRIVQQIHSQRQTVFFVEKVLMSSIRRFPIWCESKFRRNLVEPAVEATSCNLDINVRSLGHPFRMTGIQFPAADKPNVWILNTISNELVIGTIDTVTNSVFFLNEIAPDQNGRIQLLIYPKQGEVLKKYKLRANTLRPEAARFFSFTTKRQRVCQN